MQTDAFQFLAGLVKDRSGIVLTPDKVYLLESRLMPIARRLGQASLDDLVARARSREVPSVLDEIVEAMTTNESLFFRDVKPFDQFRRVALPKLIEARAGARQLKIWSAACSSGQEPYSLAMVLAEEANRLQGWRVDVLGTDLSKAMVERARGGVYSQFEVQRGMPAPMLAKYFVQDGEKWSVASTLRPMTRFHEFNLLDDPAPLGQFDVVFCRNVLIYFDQPTKAKILEQIARRLPMDGLLYLGGSETVFGITDQFAPVPGERGVYCLTRQALSVATPIRAAA
ncbi:MAG: protein-glutamate O-methyltransferase [Proteobacteria bacterium]|nr:protein-glutamate O-methyltransferase [Pseudomonadota bacterium]MBI3496339.1 protein-glutamate O-methyltransferase [Pseudomonadota bacterium]